MHNAGGGMSNLNTEIKNAIAAADEKTQYDTYANRAYG